MKEELESAICRVVKDELSVDLASGMLERPAQEGDGDWTSTVALKMGKDASRKPIDLAEALVARLQELNISGLQEVSAAGPGFINFKLSPAYFQRSLKEAMETGDAYGETPSLAGELRLIEHTSPNPNKAMHLGHLRNNVTGMSIANLWQLLGARVIRDCVDNNRGIAIAKLMWGYLKFARKTQGTSVEISAWVANPEQWDTPEERGLRPDKFIDQLYVQASEDFKNPDVEAKVRQFVRDWEAEDANTWLLWQLVLRYAHAGQEATLHRLGNHFDYVWHEHEHYKLGKDFVQKGLDENVFVRSEGAVVTRLAQYGLPDTVVEKSDGTALYITQDIALTKLKRDKFSPQSLFWVIGPEQSMAMKQMFAVCEQLGIGKMSDYHHIAYGYVSVKGQGKMSSRAGNVVYIDDLLDLVRTTILSKIAHPELSPTEKDIVAETLAVGAVKYALLKVGRTTDVAFDVDAAASLEGNSGPYIVYTYARIMSIMRQAETWEKGTTLHLLQDEKELRVLRMLDRFPEVVDAAGLTQSPNLICNYLLDTAQAYNNFYNALPVLHADSEEVRASRLDMSSTVAGVLKKGLNSLGIETVEKM